MHVLHLDLCPARLRTLLNVPECPGEDGVEGEFKGSDALKAEVAKDRQSIIGPILETPARSAARTAAFKAIAAAPSHKIGGQHVAVSERTLRDWVRQAETQGIAALLPKVRRDRGARRVTLTRTWDQAVGLDGATKQKIAAEIERLATSMVANSGTSIREVIRLWPSRPECQVFASTLFEDAELRQELVEIGTSKGTLRSMATAARSASVLAGEGPVTLVHVRQAFKMMGGR